MPTTSNVPQLPFSNEDLSWLRDLARALVGDPWRADDLVQETMVAALDSRPALIQEPRAWLRSVARRLRARQDRDEIRRRDHESLTARSGGLEAESTEPSSADLVAAAEAAERVSKTARALPEPYRKVILERYLEGLEPAEMAARSAEKPDTIRWRLRRGLELMRADLDQSSRDADGHEAAEHWSVALMPLATLAPGSLAVHAVAPSKTASLLTTSSKLQPAAALITMKLTVTTVIILVALGLFAVVTFQDRSHAEPSAGSTPVTDVASLTPELEDGPEPETDLAPVESSPDRMASERSSDLEKPAALSMTGIVVDDVGKPIMDALVFIAAAAPPTASGDPAPPSIAARTSTDRSGRFTLTTGDDAWTESSDASLSLQAAANGYVRSAPRDVRRKESLDQLELMLTTGLTVEGRVEDESGRPVPGLALWAGDRFRSAGDLSASRVALRGARRFLTSQDGDSFGQCIARTDSGGRVTLTGLPEGRCAVRSLDPTWQILDHDPIQSGEKGIVWVAARRFGVTVRASRSGTPLWRPDGAGSSLAEVLEETAVEISSKFKVELTMEDDSVIDTGQWIGSGPGEVTLALMPSMDPSVDLSKVRSARFYGTARLRDGSLAAPVEWSAPPVLRDTLENSGPAIAYVNFEGPAAPEEDGSSTDPEIPKVDVFTVTFDVVVAGTAAPFDGPLYVDWTCTLPDGMFVGDNDRAKRLPNGRYSMKVPAEEVEFVVAVGGASGSLAPWVGTKEVGADGATVVFVELDAGGTALVRRPPGWKGDWFIRAAYLVDPAAEEEEWFGAWTYGIDAPVHPLRALREGTWRFELRQDPDQDEPSEVRFAEIRPGEAIDVP